MNHSHNFVHGEATPFWYAERGKTSYNQVTLPWDCSIHNSSWQGKEVPMARYGGLSLLATETVPANLRNVMHSLHSSVTIYLDAGPPGASNSPSAGTPSDMPAANVSEIMFHLMHASNLAHYWPTESQSFPVHAALSRVKKDLKLYSKVARCIIMEHHFGNKDFKLRVTDIVKEVGRPGMPPLPDEPGWSEEDKIDFWRTENNNHGIATLWSTGENESLEWWWKPSASGYWTIVTGSNQKPKNEIETPDPITGEDRPKKEGGSVIQWAGGRWSALSKAVATFCFTGGELGTKVELAILRAFQCALCGIESAGSGTSDREAGYRLIYPTTVDLAWLLLGSPDEPRGGLNSPFYPYQPNSTIPKVCGSDDPPGAASDLGALRSLLSSPSACDPEKNCQIVWEATGEVDRGRLAQMGNCSLHLCGKSSAIVGEMSPLEGGYVNNFDPRSDPWGTGVGMPGNTATLALQDPFGGPSRGAGGMAGVAGSPAAEQGSGGIKGGVKMVACCKWDTSEGAPLNAEISMGNMSMEDCQSREGHECVA